MTTSMTLLLEVRPDITRLHFSSNTSPTAPHDPAQYAVL